ncbi:hypothetical protein HELRODRAFT_63393 [Helobdella robusta]|uniref:Transient receptor ion channel domain-containing protein n=1 Tax=Helobdella robusta TaxID=6412 RepID=T1FXF2_HELRO|nr:hypothetical protein HELRODRAFT_63393 [Helobdella robusta]ESO12412.1 hypothetical protein HELRODRAFT_63393 [Helobdella robusta]
MDSSNDKHLNHLEKVLLCAVEKGDKHLVVRCLHAEKPVDINCSDFLGRSPIQIAVEKRNISLIKILLEQDGIQIGNTLLYAICEGTYEIVEMLIDHHSVTADMIGSDWGFNMKNDFNISDEFFPEISPIVLAAHCNHFEIIQLLISRGATINKPHPLSCSCSKCRKETFEDSLRYSLQRIQIFRALSSPAWISLTSFDPVLTAFRLSWELEHLAMKENEFRDLYANLSEQCKQYACNLLDQCRSSHEVIAVLNKSVDSAYDKWTTEWSDINKLTLDRLKLALKYRQKQFVAHPHCQQLLASVWFEGIPGWRRRNFITKVVIIITLICFLPIMALIYLVFPRSRIGRLVRTPFMKFMYHSVSFGVFLFLLILVSTNFGAADGEYTQRQHQRGPPPTNLECLIVAYVMGFVWGECKQLWDEGLKAYLRQWWNWLDFIMLSLYLCTLSLRLIAYFHSQHPDIYGLSLAPRNQWPETDPTFVSEGVFAIANVFSFARIIYLFQANPLLGPLQISLGCMLIDIGKFFFIFFLVITSFACGLNQLYYFYSSSNSSHEIETNHQMTSQEMQNTNYENAFNPSYVTLFWSLFGLTQLQTVRDGQLKAITKAVGECLLMFYHTMAVIVLINMLIAMMSNSYREIEDHADREWKFARTKLWMGYFDDGSTLPPPFNILISPKSIYYFLRSIKLLVYKILYCCHIKPSTKKMMRKSMKSKEKLLEDNRRQYTVRSIYLKNGLTTMLTLMCMYLFKILFVIYQQDVMRKLVNRFIHQWKIQLRQESINEDHISEIKQDISSLRRELQNDFKKDEFQSSFMFEKIKKDIARLARRNSNPPFKSEAAFTSSTKKKSKSMERRFDSTTDNDILPRKFSGTYNNFNSYPLADDEMKNKNAIISYELDYLQQIQKQHGNSSPGYKQQNKTECDVNLLKNQIIGSLEAEVGKIITNALSPVIDYLKRHTSEASSLHLQFLKLVRK